jgi:hypothetical protein
MSQSHETEIRRLNQAFFVLVCTAIGWTAVAIVIGTTRWAFHVILPGVSGVVELFGKDVRFVDRVVVVAIAAGPDLFWVWGLVQLARLSRMFGKGEILTERTARQLQWFGLAIFLSALAEPTVLPGVGWFLFWRGYIGPLGSYSCLARIGGALYTLLGAVLVFLVARIMGTAARISEDARLTI